MKREIKFRQFNKKLKRFHYWGFIEKGMFVSPMDNPDNDWSESQQFTGLLDKDETGIYEGDILDGAMGKQKIVWSEDVGIGYGFIWEPLEKNTESITGFIDEYEVIGNIYDNPELLKI